MILGLRLGFRLLDFEKSQDLIGKDSFNMLIILNSLTIFANVIGSVHFFKQDTLVLKIAVFTYTTFSWTCVIISYAKNIQIDFAKPNDLRG